jgi:hypothetical protein
MSQFLTGFDRAPKTIDLAQTNKFRLTIHKYPYVEYFCQKANIPGLDIPEFIQPSQFTAIVRPATTINYEKLNVTFLVTEDMQNWLQLHDWMTKIVPTRSFKEVIQPEKEIYSDITLTYLSNKSQRVMEVLYKQCWPKTLSGLILDATTLDSANLVASVTFSHAGATVLHKSTNKESPVA